MTIGARLREEIESWGSIREFQREIAKTGVRGTSYATLHSYLADKTRPSEEFLRAAARLLEARFEWLRDGSGAPKERDQRITDALFSALFPGRDLEDETRLPLGAPFSIAQAVPELTDLSPAELAMFSEALRRYLASAPADEVFGFTELIAASELLWRLLKYPLEQPGFRHELTMDYVIAMLHALTLAMPGRGEGEDLLLPLMERFQKEETDGHEEV